MIVPSLVRFCHSVPLHHAVLVDLVCLRVARQFTPPLIAIGLRYATLRNVVLGNPGKSPDLRFDSGILPQPSSNRQNTQARKPPPPFSKSTFADSIPLECIEISHQNAGVRTSTHFLSPTHRSMAVSTLPNYEHPDHLLSTSATDPRRQFVVRVPATRISTVCSDAKRR